MTSKKIDIIYASISYNSCYLITVKIPCVYYNMDNREHVLFLKKMKNNDTCIEVGTKKL